MNRRDLEAANTPPPKYDPNSHFFTLCINYGGKFHNGKGSTYIGGKKVALDYVNKDVFTLHILESLVRNEGVNRPVRLYSRKGDRFILMKDDIDLARMYELKSESGRLVELYVDEREQSVGTETPVEREASHGYVFNEEGSGESDDFDYDVDDANCVDYDLDDDKWFAENVDPDAEWFVAFPNDECENTRKSGAVEGLKNDECSEEDIVKSDVDLDSGKDSGSERKDHKFPIFTTSQLYDPTFELGMKFTTKDILRQAIHSFAVKTHRNIKIVKNDKTRMHAKCADKQCKWALHGLNIPGEPTFQIRLFNAAHSCQKSFKVKNMHAKWIAGNYLHKFQNDPKRDVKEFRVDAILETRCDISHFQAYRAKRKAIDTIEGECSETARRRAKDELTQKVKKRLRGKLQVQSNQHRLRRQQTTIACGICGGKGHNKKYCPQLKSTERQQVTTKTDPLKQQQNQQVTTKTDPFDQQQNQQEEKIVSQYRASQASEYGAGSSNLCSELGSSNRLTKLKVKRKGCQSPPTPNHATRQSTKSWQTTLRSGKCF